jgi:hypothetical protein
MQDDDGHSLRKLCATNRAEMMMMTLHMNIIIMSCRFRLKDEGASLCEKGSF